MFNKDVQVVTLLIFDFFHTKALRGCDMSDKHRCLLLNDQLFVKKQNSFKLVFFPGKDTLLVIWCQKLKNSMYQISLSTCNNFSSRPKRPKFWSFDLWVYLKKTRHWVDLFKNIVLYLTITGNILKSRKVLKMKQFANI